MGVGVGKTDFKSSGTNIIRPGNQKKILGFTHPNVNCKAIVIIIIARWDIL